MIDKAADFWYYCHGKREELGRAGRLTGVPHRRIEYGEAVFYDIVTARPFAVFV